MKHIISTKRQSLFVRVTVDSQRPEENIEPKRSNVVRFSTRRSTLLTTLILLMLSFTSKAQNVDYKILYDDPNRIPPLVLYLNPFYMDLWGSNVSAGADLKAEIRVKKWISLYADAGLAVWGDAESKREPKGARSTYTDLTGYIHLIDKNTPAAVKVALSSSQQGYTVTTKYITVPAERRKIKALRVGLLQINSPIDLDAKKGVKSLYASAFSAEDLETGNLLSDEKISELMNTIMHVKILSAGISFRRITNVKINTDYARRGKRSNKSMSDFYFDVLIGLSTTFENAVSEDGEHYYKIANPQMKKIGWRVGYVFASSAKSSITYKAELSSRPGLKGGNVAFSLGVGWTIPFALGVKPQPKN